MKHIQLVVMLALISSPGKTQDPQFSQFYASPLYLAPSFAGSTGGGRVVLNFRDQWPQLASTYVTYAFSADYYYDKYKSGVGLLLLRDQAGEDGMMNTTTAGLAYSYNFNVSPDWSIRPGLSAYYYSRMIDFNTFRFGDQILRGDNYGNAGSSVEMTTLENLEPVSHVDFTTSVMAYSETYWFGFTLDHLMYYSKILAEEGDYLPPRYSLFGGAKYMIYGNTLKRSEESITVALNFMTQNRLKYLDLGLYYTKAPIILGLWYRGLPIFPDNPNVGALAFSVGVKHKGIHFGYSYDFTMSRLINQTGGAHEVSLGYVFSERKKRRTRHKMVPCPVM